MKTVGIVIDKWKLSVFEKYLDAAKFSYKRHPGLTDDTLLLKVKTEFVSTLQPVVEAAQEECKNTTNI